LLLAKSGGTSDKVQRNGKIGSIGEFRVFVRIGQVRLSSRGGNGIDRIMNPAEKMEIIPRIGTGIHLLFRWLRECFAKNVPEAIDALAKAAYHLNLAEKLLFLPGLRRRGDPRT
jgi:hypothetical protein